MRTTKEELADWIESGLVKRTQVSGEELAGIYRGAYDLFSGSLLGIALMGKVGHAIKAYELLDLEFHSKGLTKIRSLTVEDLAKQLGISLGTAEAIEELHRLYQVPPSVITKLLRSLVF
jgi:hypothetical protein